MDTTYGRFDRVRLVTTRRVSYLSSRPGSEAGPGGEWTVSDQLGQDLLLTKDGTVIRIPAADCRLSAKYNPDLVDRELRAILKRGYRG